MNEVDILCVLKTKYPVKLDEAEYPVKLDEADVPVTLEDEAYPVKLDEAEVPVTLEEEAYPVTHTFLMLLNTPRCDKMYISVGTEIVPS